MPSTPVLVLIALTVLACAFIVALLLKIRSQHIAAQPVFGRNYTADDEHWTFPKASGKAKD